MIKLLICSRSKKLYGQVLPGDTTTDAMKQFVPYHKTHEALKKNIRQCQCSQNGGFQQMDWLPSNIKPGLKENMKFQHKTRIKNQIKSDDRPENTRFDPLKKCC